MARPLRGTIRVPGDKSISHRALILAALAVGTSRIENLNDGGDVRATTAALRALGARIEAGADGAWMVDGVGVGGLLQPQAPCDCGNSGTTARLLMGLVASHGIRAEFAGDASLRRRPMDRVADPLRRIGAKIDRDLVKPTWPSMPADWQMKRGSAGEMAVHDTGWTVTKLPPGFTKITEGYRSLRGKRDPVAHLVFSDGLVAVSVFIEPRSSVPVQSGPLQQGALNVYSMKVDDQMVTALGEVPGATVRQIAASVARR